MKKICFRDFFKNLFLQTFLFSLFLFSGCKKNQPIPPNDTLHLYLQAEPFSLDSRVGGDRRSQVLLRSLFEGLTRLNKTGGFELALAKSYSVSPDGLVYTFYLRDALWSNGDKVRAEDFCYAWKSALSPQFSTAFAYAFFVIKNAKKAKMNECSLDDVGVTALDEHTLQVTLEHPTPYFLELTANPLFFPVYKTLDESDPVWSKSSFPNYVSNGPFILREHSFRSHILLERNPLYWDTDQAKTFRISFPIIDSPTTAYALFEKGELDWFGDPCGLCDLEIIQKLMQDGSMISKESGSLYWIVCCTKKPYLASAKIRQAIASSISRHDVCYLLLKGGERPATSVVPSFISNLGKPVFQDGNIEYAKKCFEEGLVEVGLTRETFPTLQLTHWAEPLSKIMAQYFQQKIESTLHIHVVLDSCDWGTYMQKVPAGNIDIASASWLTWVADPIFNLQYLKYRNNGINGTCWQNDQYVALLDKAENTLALDERTEYLKQAEEIVARELPLIPLYELTNKYVKAPGLTGEVVSHVGMFSFKWLEKKQEDELISQKYQNASLSK